MASLDPKPRPRHYLEYGLAHLIISVARLFPYRKRVIGMGWLTRRVFGRVTGWQKRAKKNLAYVWPDTPPERARAIIDGSLDNAGRAIIETWSADEFAQLNKKAPLIGPGAEAFRKAREAGQPVLIVTGHFGNYDAIGLAMRASGFEFGALYKAMKNPLFNKAYVAAIGQFCDALFATDRRGVTQMARHLKSGGIAAMNLDVHRYDGSATTFLGKPVLTATTPAEWALKFGALLLPVYTIRQPDGFSFEVFVDTPVVPNSDLTAVTQELCDSLERQVILRPEQWFWIHRRWKGDPNAPR